MARSKSIPPLQEEQAPNSSNVLLVQIDSSPPSDLHRALEREGFRVIARSTIREALICVAKEKFVALICDLHLPAAGDGFTLVNAMRHFHADAITVIMSDYPALRESVSALLPQADEVLVMPVQPHEVVTRLKDRLRDPKHRAANIREPVSTILERYALDTIREWLARVNGSKELGHVNLSEEARTGHLRTLLKELVQRLREPHLDEGKAQISLAAIAHGRARSRQGYTSAMLVEESRILQVCIFKTLRNHLSAVDLTLVLTDVMTIADEVDSQLKQTMASFSDQLTRELMIAG